MSEEGYAEVKEAEPEYFGIGVVEGGSETGLRTARWIEHRKRTVGFLLAVLFALSGCMFILAPDTEAGSVESSPTLQNQRIMCWGGSTTLGVGAKPGGTYADHLGRLLGREVDYLLGDTESVDLGRIEMFSEDRYGIFIYQFRFEDFGCSWGMRIRGMGQIIRNLQETGAVVVAFETMPIWNVSGQPTALHYLCYTGTRHEKNNPKIVKVNVGNETRIRKYYEMWGETVTSEIAAEEGAYFIPAYEDWDCLDLCSGVFSCCDLPFQTHDILGNSSYLYQLYGSKLTHIHPELMGALHHHNAMGYGVLAERIARYLVDWGLGEYVMSYEEMAKDLPSLYSAAEERMESIEGFGFALDEPRRMFEIAESLEESGYVYTARWILEERIVNGLPEPSRLEDISAMVSEANATIAEAKRSGVDEGTIAGLETCLGSAETALNDLDLNGTEAFLERIMDAPKWQNISSMFVKAQETISELEEAGDRNAFIMKADYSRAVKAFGECDHELAVFYLKKIPEAVCACVFALWLLGLFRRSMYRRLP